LPPGARAIASERTQPAAEAAHALLVGDGTAIPSLVPASDGRTQGLIIPRLAPDVAVMPARVVKN